MTSESSAIGAVRERRRAERDRPDRRDTILGAAEGILARTPLHELSVAAIMREAGVSRGTFYGYFESKFDVVVALMDRVMVAMYDLLRPYVDRQPGVDAAAAIRQVITDSADLWHRHAALFRATHDHRHAIPELKSQWLRVTEQFTDAVAEEIARDSQARDPRQIAAALVWATEHLLYVAGSGDDADLPGEMDIVDTLVNLWMGAIYGS